jgi:hypothetical protein
MYVQILMIDSLQGIISKFTSYKKKICRNIKFN